MIAAILALDVRVLDYLYGVRSADVVQFMAGVSAWSEWTIILPVAAACASLLYLAARRAEALGLAVAVFGSGLAVLVLKYSILRPRPPVHFWAIQEMGPSFPSAHAALAVAFWGFLAYLLWRRTRESGLRALILLFAVLIPLLVGFSRLYLGVHYFSDVVAGFAVGGLFLWFGIIAARRLPAQTGQGA